KRVIMDGRGASLPDGNVGQIGLLTPSRMSGYLGRRREKRRAIPEEILRTGDLGYVRGGELFWVGRVRERITLRGRKIDPSDFERVLLDVPGLRAGCFAAFGVDDPSRGTQRLVIVTEVRDGAAGDATTIVQQVRGAIEEQLGISPDEVVLVSSGTLAK